MATEVSLTAPGAPQKFVESLREASLTVSTAGQTGVTAQDLLAAAQADYARLIGLLYAEGYYGSVIRIRADGQEAASIPPLSAPREIRQIDITIERRGRFQFSNARVAPLPPKAVLPKDFSLGQPARVGLIGEAARAGIDAWRSTGHAKADIAEQNIIVNHARHTVDADIRLAPGPRLRFGELEIVETGQPSRVRASRIREIAGLPTGKTFSPEEIEQSANRLRRTGAFRSVVMTEANTPNADATLDIAASVLDAKRRRISAGVELFSEQGLTLSGIWLHRNLLGGAERLRIEAMMGGIGGDSGGEDYRLDLRFDRPATFTPDTGLFLLAKIEQNDEPEFRERIAEIGGGLTHVFSEELTAEAGISYRFSDISDGLGNRELQNLLFPVAAIWDRRDDPLNATRGFYLNLTVTPFLGLDDVSGGGTRFFGDARYYRKLDQSKRFIMAARAQIGSVAGADISEVPADLLFYSGGAGTVRGQPYQSLGVDLAPGITVGGRSFMGYSAELRGRVNDKVQAVTFIDTGYVARDALGTGQGDWHSGAGLGARYLTPVGPIRVDIATPLDDDTGNSFEIYIGIGQAF